MTDQIIWDMSASAPRNSYPGQIVTRTDDLWNAFDLSKQIDLARVDGLLDASYASANQYGLSVTWGLAIFSRESNMKLTAVGDKGKAYGPSQVHPPKGVDGSKFFDPEYAADYTFHQLSLLWNHLQIAYPDIDLNTLEQVLFACWNRGLHGEEVAFAASWKPDLTTAHMDYGRDSQMRRLCFDAILGASLASGPDPE
jgi:hypothetical protein